MKNIFMVIVSLVIAYSLWLFYTEDNGMVKGILKLDSLPNSVSNIECESLAITDVMTTCSFTIDPLEFNKLLTGWSFKEEDGVGSAYKYAKLGKDFLIDKAYVAYPKEFKHGGSVSVVVDKSRKFVMAELYIE